MDDQFFASILLIRSIVVIIFAFVTGVGAEYFVIAYPSTILVLTTVWRNKLRHILLLQGLLNEIHCSDMVLKFIILLTFLKWIFSEVVVFLTTILDQSIPIGIFLKAILITNYP